MPFNSLKELVDLLQSQNAKWIAGDNEISLMPEAAQKKLLGSEENSIELADIGAALLKMPVNLEKEVDWRCRNGVNHISPVKNQGSNGACVAFATVGVVESMAHIEKNVWLNLSEADHLFCSSHGESMRGWNEISAMKQLLSRGACDEEYFPYATAYPNNDILYYMRNTEPPYPVCVKNPGRESRAVKITEIMNLGNNRDNVKYHLSHVGPVAASMKIYKDFYRYKSGVYSHIAGDYGGYHCIMIVGYSDVDGCWICKNSWGVTWGMSGFFKIAYGECGIDDSNKVGAKGIVLPGFKALKGKGAIAGKSKWSPALRMFKCRVYAAWTDSTDGKIKIASSADGAVYGTATSLNISAWSAPSLAVHNGLLYMAWCSNTPGGNILVASSADGVTFSKPVSVNEVSGNAPCITSFNGMLLVAWNDKATNRINIASSNDGISFAGKTVLGFSCVGSPSLTVLNGMVNLAWVETGQTGSISTMSSSDGKTFAFKKSLSQQSRQGVSLGNDGSSLWMLWGNQSNGMLSLKSLFPDLQEASIGEAASAAPSISFPFIGWCNSAGKIMVATIS